jgi:hypothetical protein
MYEGRCEDLNKAQVRGKPGSEERRLVYTIKSVACGPKFSPATGSTTIIYFKLFRPLRPVTPPYPPTMTPSNTSAERHNMFLSAQ